ncbi:hypothetical protein [Pseudonocardia sp. N23]|uniref:hypothetical protein n=1 Tax=Pseudonocardia sp. N23 TaxID=1987376 RepID=UPI00114554AA|nr:hypothetical protein [Pseudonocardia sp. N23]
MTSALAYRVAMIASGLVSWALAHALTDALFTHAECSQQLDHVIGPVLLTGTAAVVTSFVAVAVAALYGPEVDDSAGRPPFRTSIFPGALPLVAFVVIELVEHVTVGQPVLSAVIAATSLCIHVGLGIIVARAVLACTGALRATLQIFHAHIALRRAAALSATAPPRRRASPGFTVTLDSRGPPVTAPCPVLVPALTRPMA